MEIKIEIEKIEIEKIEKDINFQKLLDKINSSGVNNIEIPIVLEGSDSYGKLIYTRKEIEKKLGLK